MLGQFEVENSQLRTNMGNTLPGSAAGPALRTLRNFYEVAVYETF